MENYYEALPEGYSVNKVIDAKDKKTVIWLNVVGSLLMILALIVLCVLRRDAIFSFFTKIEDGVGKFLTGYLLVIGIFLGGYVAYMILHELTHGVAYKALTHQKLKFGFTGFVAFCGVPDGYVSKKTALISLLAPFTVYTILLLPPCFIFDSGAVMFAFILLFAAHFGGCVGDLYDTFLLLTRYDDTVLMNDTGPTQTFYVKKM